MKKHQEKTQRERERKRDREKERKVAVFPSFGGSDRPSCVRLLLVWLSRPPVPDPGLPFRLLGLALVWFPARLCPTLLWHGPCHVLSCLFYSQSLCLCPFVDKSRTYHVHIPHFMRRKDPTTACGWRLRALKCLTRTKKERSCVDIIRGHRGVHSRHWLLLH